MGGERDHVGLQHEYRRLHPVDRRHHRLASVNDLLVELGGAWVPDAGGWPACGRGRRGRAPAPARDRGRRLTAASSSEGGCVTTNTATLTLSNYRRRYVSGSIRVSPFGETANQHCNIGNYRGQSAPSRLVGCLPKQKRYRCNLMSPGGSTHATARREWLTDPQESAAAQVSLSTARQVRSRFRMVGRRGSAAIRGIHGLASVPDANSSTTFAIHCSSAAA